MDHGMSEDTPDSELEDFIESPMESEYPEETPSGSGGSMGGTDGGPDGKAGGPVTLPGGGQLRIQLKQQGGGSLTKRDIVYGLLAAAKRYGMTLAKNIAKEVWNRSVQEPPEEATGDRSREQVMILLGELDEDVQSAVLQHLVGFESPVTDLSAKGRDVFFALKVACAADLHNLMDEVSFEAEVEILE